MMISLSEAAEFLRNRDDFVILTHRAPDGDTLGSAAALCNALRELGKSASLLRNAQTTELYSRYVERYFDAPLELSNCTLIAVDSASVELLQHEYDGSNIALAIDHHPSHTEFAVQTLVNATKASCGEVVLELLRELAVPHGAETATQLYIAVSTDTGCFRYKNTSAETLEAAAELVRAGAPSGDLNHRLFMVKRMSRLKLEGLMLSRLELYIGGELAIATITLDMMRQCGAETVDLEDVATVAGQAEGVEMSVTLREMHDGRTKVSVRTVNYANANALCAYVGGGGHGMAAGATCDADIPNTKAALLRAINNVWKGEEFKI